MTYTSEKFTRYCILKFSQKFLKQESMKRLIIEGSLTSGSVEAKEKYFWFGSTLFLVSGFSVELVLLIAAVLMTFLFFPLGYLNFFLYAPGLIMILIGLYLDTSERRTKRGTDSIFTNRHLLEAIVIGLLIALFIVIK